MKETCGTDPGIESWYVEFQGAVFNNLPRRIPKYIALKWANSGKELSRAFHRALLSQKARCHLFFDAQSYTIKINSSDGRTKEQVLWDSHYFEISPGVNSPEAFPIRPIESWIEIEVLDFKRNITSADAISIAENYGLQRPSYEHALLFGEQQLAEPVDHQAPIVFLHEPWEDPLEKEEGQRRKVIVLQKPGSHSMGPKLVLRLHSFDMPEWGNRERYRAIGGDYKNLNPNEYGPQTWEAHKFAFIRPPGQ